MRGREGGSWFEVAARCRSRHMTAQHQTDGSVVGIDFGMAFGGGSSLLPVPELLPFRLTPQFTDLLQPLDTSGLLKSTMVSVP